MFTCLLLPPLLTHQAASSQPLEEQSLLDYCYCRIGLHHCSCWRSSQSCKRKSNTWTAGTWRPVLPWRSKRCVSLLMTPVYRRYPEGSAAVSRCASCCSTSPICCVIPGRADEPLGRGVSRVAGALFEELQGYRARHHTRSVRFNIGSGVFHSTARNQ